MSNSYKDVEAWSQTMSFIKITIWTHLPSLSQASVYFNVFFRTYSEHKRLEVISKAKGIILQEWGKE